MTSTRRRTSTALFALAGALLLVVLVGVLLDPSPPTAPDGEVDGPTPPAEPVVVDPDPEDWLGTINAYRASAGLGPVDEDPSLTSGAEAHARYMIVNEWLGHGQDPDNPAYSPEGDAASENGLLFVGWERSSPRETIELWMAGPFHALPLLHPQLARVAYGEHTDPDAGRWPWAAVLDVRGTDASLPAATQPVVWPGDGSAVPLTSFIDEYPNPLAPCEGYDAPTGLPIIAIFGDPTTRLATAELTDESGELLETCAYDSSGYEHRSDHATQTAREIMTNFGAVVVIPREPLTIGSTYSVTVASTDGATITWSFDVTDGPIRAAARRLDGS